MARPGWHSRGYLPHCDEEGLVQHVVLRLADSLPASVLRRTELLSKLERYTVCERKLDAGTGSSIFRTADHAVIVEDALLHFDAERYALVAWCIMPNHAHVVIEPWAAHALGKIVKSWKSYSAAKINERLVRTGRLWAADYFDRFMRSDEHLRTTIAYVENNPVAAGLCSAPHEWAFSSASKRR